MTELHREDGPAVENTDGTTYWYFNNKYHRTNGPADCGAIIDIEHGTFMG